MKIKIIAYIIAAAVMAVLPLFVAEIRNRAEHIIDYTSGDIVIPVSVPDSFIAESSDIVMPGIIKVYDAARGETFEIDTEEYITGVVAAEMPSAFNPEALKAQAVAARSYLLYKLTNNPGGHADGASVCTDYKCCKAYLSAEEAAARWTEQKADEVFDIIRAATEPVRGLIITYDDAVACALFHASSSGKTESSVNVWGGELPYLHSVYTPESEEPFTTVFGADELTDKLRGAGYDVRPAGDIAITCNDTGRADYITVGGVSVPAGELRSILGLRSTLFTVERQDGDYIFTCYGYGHGVGMSQVGAAAMADSGYTYDEILLHYYKGTALRAVKYESTEN
ncbi:MAG: stage II sporulation protein D [Eubacteriales bacterium]|nr:stage II sporulation protein D [Eubacteriales bacterium]